MNKTKIDWCDCTVIPVIGCKNGCKYCYAERLNKRFHYIPNWKCPQFRPEKLKQFYSKKPKSIFIDSMSDIGTWRQEWLEQVIDAIVANPQHNYIALTKRPDMLSEKLIAIRNKVEDRNFYPLFGDRYLFFGISITTQVQSDKVMNAVDFYSVEPILEPITLPWRSFPKAIIIGAETGNRKGKVIPKKEWVDDLVRQANENKIAVFMKGSLRQLMGDDFRQDKLPWDIER